MHRLFLALIVFVLTVVFSGGYSAWAQFPNNPSFTRLFTSITSGIEGLTGDDKGFFYVVDRGVGNANCSVWKIDSKAAPNTAVLVGKIVGTCRPSGLTFDKHGDLFITTAVPIVDPNNPNPNTNVIYKLTPDATNPTSGGALGQVVVTGVFGANGVAFDKFGKFYISDGVTNQGRVWRVNSFPADCTTTNPSCEELFRIPPRLNAVGVGSQRTADAPLVSGLQNLVANGLAFNHSGDLLIADTARGAIWKAEFTNGNLKPNQTNCDPTFLLNTLCFDTLWVADPRLEGLDGIALDLFGNVWGTANERNALLVVTSVLKRVIEVFQNPPVSSLRNNGPLEFPTSPFLSGKTLCITQADSNRRDNVPNTAGDIAGSGAGKVSCMVESLIIPGLPLPVH